MTQELPAPLVPPEVDLRGLPFMPLDTVRLMDSDIFALSTGEEFKSAVALWCKAWQQVPGGSLPDDDRVLAHLSGAGSRWKKVREMALRGFVKCSDGRLYHVLLAEKAIAAWAHRTAQRDRAAKRWDAKNGNATASKTNATAHAAAYAVADAAAMQGRGRGRGRVKETPFSKKAAASNEAPTVEKTPEKPPLADEKIKVNPEGPEADLAARLAEQGVTISADDPLIADWIGGGITFEIADAAVAKARSPKRKPEGPIPAPYLATIVTELLTGAKPNAGKPWFLVWSGIKGQGKRLGITQQEGEHEQAFRQRVYLAAGVTEETVRNARRDWP